MAEMLRSLMREAAVSSAVLLLFGAGSALSSSASAQAPALFSGPSASSSDHLAAANVPSGPSEALTRLGVVRSSLVSAVTGPGAPNPSTQWGVHGTDLGHMFWHRGALYMVFGDTFGEGNRHKGRDWRSNVLARMVAPTAGSGLHIESMIAGANGLAKELLPSRKVNGLEMTVIPTNGISTGERMFLHYMSVRRWKDHGDWDVRHSGLAYSDDDGETWTVPDSATWSGGTGFEQVAFVREGGYVYAFGIPEGRHGGVRLRRVPEGEMLDPTAREYWDGTTWVRGQHQAAVTVVPGPAGELSVAWNARHGQWMMMYLDSQQDAVMLRFAPNLTGPWGPAQTVVSSAEQPGLYAPYIVPFQNIGDEVWFTMSKWGPYNVFLMQMTLGDVVSSGH